MQIDLITVLIFAALMIGLLVSGVAGIWRRLEIIEELIRAAQLPRATETDTQDAIVNDVMRLFDNWWHSTNDDPIALERALRERLFR
jgi:hypothetical protein